MRPLGVVYDCAAIQREKRVVNLFKSTTMCNKTSTTYASIPRAFSLNYFSWLDFLLKFPSYIGRKSYYYSTS